MVSGVPEGMLAMALRTPPGVNCIENPMGATAAW